jgi:DUF4097 and DUF4098 domain-containing protein YvlB
LEKTLNNIRNFALLSLIFSAPFAAARCDEEKTIKHEFDRDSFTAMHLHALAGELKVRGNNSDKIIFHGVACSDEQQYLDRISLDISEDSSELTLTVIIPYSDHDFDANYAYMDIDLTLPSDFSISIKDSSGNVTVEDAQVLLIDDSSGEINVRESRGNLILKDSSGDIDVNDHTGNIVVTDSSGNIDISRISGSVTIPGDSSGEIEIDNVGNFVRIDNDSSGSIQIEEVGADVTIGNDGSGDINISEVKGSVIVENDGSGRVKVTQVDGNFTLRSKGSGNIKTRDIAGQVSLPRNKSTQ